MLLSIICMIPKLNLGDWRNEIYVLWFTRFSKITIRLVIKFRCNVPSLHQQLKEEYTLRHIDPDKEILFALKFNYCLTHWFKHVFWVLKRTVSMRRFF